MTSASGCKKDSSAKTNPRQRNLTGMSRLHAFFLLSALCGIVSHGQPVDVAKLDGFFNEVTRNDARLLLKTQGATFETEPINANYFMHTPSGYFFEFHPDHAELRIKETDNIYYLKREE